MIPRIIHYCWFSGTPYPERIQKCMDSWHIYMSDYRFELWDYQRIKEIDNIWLQECLHEQKWAFAADFVRLYSVFHYGGIYLDTDVEVFRSFDSLLQNECFIGREWSWKTSVKYTNFQGLTSHSFGSIAGNYFIACCLQYYEDRHFILSNITSLPPSLRYSQVLMPVIQCEIAKEFGYQPDLRLDGSIYNYPSLTIYPSSFFDPYQLSKQSYCRHLCLGGWQERQEENVNITFVYRLRYHLEKYLKWVLWHLGYTISRK